MSIRKTNEQFVEEVFNLVGNEYSVLGQYKASDIKVEIKHNKCGHVYEVLPSNFHKGKRCPKCQHRSFKKTTPEFKYEIDSLVGKEYTVLGEYINAKTKILIQHNKCCHKYEVTPHDFLLGTRCPWCSQSKGEKEIWNYLESNGYKFKSQYKISDCRNIKPLPFDFAIFNKEDKILALIEFDGMQHYRKIGYTNGTEKLESLQKNEKIKNEYCNEKNIYLIRVPYNIKDIKDYLSMRIKEFNLNKMLES